MFYTQNHQSCKLLFLLFYFYLQLGLDVKAILASLGVGGIAIALAAKDTLANFFASLNIMTDNSFSQGDWIKQVIFRKELLLILEWELQN